MCGITGIFGVEEITDAKDRLLKMNDKLAHRGPDAAGFFEANNCVLGHRRLSIIDLNPSSNQPFSSADGRYTMVYNGELYNYLEIKAQLSDYPFRTNSDTEVLLAAFQTWGPAALQLFNGMFAFAIWDQEREKLWLARDRMGIKPLYYAHVGQSVVFASEVRSILASGLVEKKLNKDVLVEYLRYQSVQAPNTLVEGVQMLEAATYLEISDNEVRKHQYWQPWINPHTDVDLTLVQGKIRTLFTESVERRLVADVPFGAFLSGGIDSSLIVAVMSEVLGHKVDTFNVSFDEREFSEAKYARIVANRYRTNHHEIQLKPEDFLDSLPLALRDMDHPSGDGPNTWIVSRQCKRQGITMALSGLGGDEVFAGYDVFKRIPEIADRGWILSFPKVLRALAGNAYEMAKPGMVSSKMKAVVTADYFDLEHLYPIMRQVLLDSQIRNLTGKSAGPNQLRTYIQDLERFTDFTQLPVLSRISIAEFGSYMQHVLLRDTDQMSMAHALEVRVPFLDHKLVEYAMYIPDNLKFPYTPKQLLVSTFADFLPHEVVNRPKMGFVLPWEHWMRGEMRIFCEARMSDLKSTGLFKAQALDSLWQKFLRNDPSVSWSRVWPLIVLSDWMHQNDIEA